MQINTKEGGETFLWGGEPKKLKSLSKTALEAAGAKISGENAVLTL